MLKGSKWVVIGVIYGGAVRGVPVPPLFGLRGTVPLTFQDKKVKNLLSPAANRSDLRRLNYNKTISAEAPPRTPLAELMTLSQTPELDEEGIFAPHSPPLSPRDSSASRSFSELVPPLFRPKLRPACS